MSTEPLTAEERRTLLTIARRALEHCARTGKTPGRDDLPCESLTERLEEPSGAFVTLRHRKNLRGCIGQVHPHLPLWEAVAQNAVNAGWHDPRFSPVRERELPGLTIEVTVLHAMEPITEPEEITLGEHGIMMAEGSRRGVFLPQVATEQGWDAETFFENLCHKAGLPSGSHRREGVALWRFGAEHFEEEAGS
ncbi:AmmeMemoRadiSam system protein A [Candidatus Sumerlaeota bacterium]|nr:AmmeMemoRadiSam system protein A [Candidatus Sumerlaeota bacterium]